MNKNNHKKHNYSSKETLSVSTGIDVKYLKLENKVINQSAFGKTFVGLCRKEERNKKFLLNLELNTNQGKIIFVSFNNIIHLKSFVYSTCKNYITVLI